LKSINVTVDDQVLVSTSKSRKDVWIADGGATSHITSKREWFDTYKSLENRRTFSIANGDTLEAVAVGSIKCKAFNGRFWTDIRLQNVHHVPGMKVNLLSVGAASEKGIKVVHEARSIKFINSSGNIVLTGNRQKAGLWIVKLHPQVQEKAYSANATARVWHSRLGHASARKLELMKKENTASAFEILDNPREVSCEECPFGKANKRPFRETRPLTGKPGEHLSSDLCGPMRTESLGGSRYFLLIKDRLTC
jgi:hypothetical protein